MILKLSFQLKVLGRIGNYGEPVPPVVVKGLGPGDVGTVMGRHVLEVILKQKIAKVG